MRRQTN